jgi:hypothetical protein
MEIMNHVRGYVYLAGMLKDRRTEPFCRSCKALVTTVMAARTSLNEFSSTYAGELCDLPPEFASRFAEASSDLAALGLPADPLPQKKAGTCKLPGGVCFVKSSLALYQKL